MHKACAKTIPPKAFLKHKRPGWNSSVNAVHRHSKAAWKLWKASGKPNCPTNPFRKLYLIFYGGATLVTHMTTLFNQIVEQEYIPLIFQHGLIIPIPKSYNKDPSDPSNYHGITLLSVIAKIFKKVILLCLQTAGIPNQVHPLQGGFKPGVSCIHTAFIFQEAIQQLREQKQKAHVALLDVQKPFDTVWHNGLFYKLYHYGIQDNIWCILRKWYDSSSCTVLWDGEQSRPFNINQGVKQGAILSPLLYNLFVNELVTLEQSGLGVKIGSVYCGAPMYADDLALIASSAEELQAMLDIISKYTTKWRYRINPLKSKVLLFGSNRLPTMHHLDNQRSESGSGQRTTSPGYC